MVFLISERPTTTVNCQVRLTAAVTCNKYYLLSCGADGARLPWTATHLGVCQFSIQKSSWAGGIHQFWSTVLLRVYRSLNKTYERVDGALQLWPAMHLGKGYSKIKPVCLDMPIPDMQRLFG